MARSYLVACLQNSNIHREIIKYMPREYGSLIMQPIPAAKKLFQTFAKSQNEVKKLAGDGGMHRALIGACSTGKSPLNGFDIAAWDKIFKALYYLGTTEFVAINRTTYLNLLNADGEQDEKNLADAKILEELIPLFLKKLH